MTTPDMVKHSLTLILCGLILFLSMGCQTTASGTPVNQSNTTVTAVATKTETPKTPTPTRTPAPTNTPEGAPITLTFWTVEPVSPQAEGPAGEFVEQSLRSFERSSPGVNVDLLIKKVSGKGGTLDFLRTAKKAAPKVMPDVVIMKATDLDQAFSEGLIQPLDGKLDRSIVKDLLPAARRVGTVGDSLVGVPLGIEMEHTVYNTAIYTATPTLWTDVLTRNSAYLFPARGINGLVNDATLSQYFSAGGMLITDDGVPTIDERALESVLQFYEQASAQGIVSPSILETTSTEELWPEYRAGRAGLTQISVRQYLADRETLNNSSYASVPVPDETSTPVGVMHAWVLVLVTTDVSRHNTALRLMESFLSTSINAQWNELNGSIPVRDTAYQQLAGDDPYWQFLTNQLNNARPEPRFAGYDKIGRIIQQAIEQVIRGEATADEATATAIDALSK